MISDLYRRVRLTITITSLRVRTRGHTYYKITIISHFTSILEALIKIQINSSKPTERLCEYTSRTLALSGIYPFLTAYKFRPVDSL